MNLFIILILIFFKENIVKIGVATLIGVTGLSSFCNLGWDSINNVMYLTNSGTDSLYTINLTTAAVTLVGALNGPTNPNGLAFDHVLNQMFLVRY